MQYELQLNLQQRAALSAATSFWEKQNCKDKIKQLLSSFPNDNERKDEWRKYIETVFDEWNKNELPPTLEGELIHFVRGIGEKIYNWYIYIWRGREFPFDGDFNYSDEIYWTPHGFVDEIAIFESFLPAHLSKDPTSCITKLYYIACCYTLEDHINDLWQRMDEDQDFCDEAIDEYDDRYVAAYFRYLRDDQLDNLIEYFSYAAESYQAGNGNEYVCVYNLDRSPEANMLLALVSVGSHIAVQYFWNKLTDEEKARCVIDNAYMAVNNYNWYDLEEKNPNYDHKKEKYVEITIFLMNQMTENQRELFFKKGSVSEEGSYDSWDEEKDVKNSILRMLLCTWPLQELIVPVFQNILKYLEEHDKKTVRMFLYKITSKILEDQKLGYNVDKSKFHNIFHKVWRVIPESLKQNKAYLGLNMIITNLLEARDLKNLQMIINDPEVTEVRDQYIECGRIGFLKLIFNDQYEILDKFIEEIFNSEEEKKAFKQKIHVWGDSTLDDQHLTAEMLLNFRICLPNEPKNSISDIKFIKLCEYFEKQQRHDLADKFLKWKMEPEEEKKMKTIN